MRYVAKNLSDRTFHLADEPHTRSYCKKLRGDLVILDADYASERIADRTAKVCTACRTVMNDRRAADRAMADSFMITADEVRPAARPAVEPGLFDLGDLADAGTPTAPGARAVVSAVPAVEVEPGLFGAVDAEESPGGGVLPVVGIGAVIAAGVPAVPADMVPADTAEAPAVDAAPDGEGSFLELSGARQVDAGSSAPSAVDTSAPWCPPGLHIVPLPATRYRDWWGVECGRCVPGGPTSLPGEYDDKGDAYAAARGHYEEKHRAADDALTAEEAQEAVGLSLSTAQTRVLGWAEDGKLCEYEDGGFWGLDVVPDRWDVNKRVAATRVIGLWAAGLLDVGGDCPARRVIRLSAEGRRILRLWARARRQHLVIEEPRDARLPALPARSSGYPLLSEGRYFKGEERPEAAATATPDVMTEADPVDVWEGEGGAVPGVAAPTATAPEARDQADGETAVAVMPIDWAKPAGRGDCAAANTCGGFGVLLWDVPGCAPRCAECAARVMGHSPAALRALTLPGDVVEAEEGAETADIVIRHTHEDGTTVEGSSKGDGVWEALRPLGWTYRRTPGIFIRGSRYKGADRWKINRAADAVRELGLSCAVVIEEGMSFAEREAARVDAAEERTERFADRAGRAASASQSARDASDRIGERFWMGQPILVGHHSEKGARRDQERMHNAMRKSIAEGERAGYWASRAQAADAYEQYRNNPGRTLRRIEKLEAERRGVLRERDGIDDKGRKADVWQREPSEARREELTRRLAEYDEELTYWAETIKEAERRGFKVWGRADFMKGDFARCRGTWYEVTRVNAKTVTVPHIHAEFDGGAVGAVGGCRVVTRAATAQTRHKGSTYTLPYNELSGRMSAEQMRAALAGEQIPTDPRDVTPEPAPEAAEAERAADARDGAADLAQEGAAPVGGAPAPAGVSDPGTEDGWEDDGGACAGVDAPLAPEGGSGAATARAALRDPISDPDPADVWEGEGGAVPGVDTPRGPETGPTVAELGPVPGPGGADVVTAAGAPAADAAPKGEGKNSELTWARQFGGVVDQPKADTTTVGVSEATQQWCADRDHPFITYNPWLDRTYCRCGERQEPGEQPHDWEASREVFHDCQPGDPCRCYATGKHVPAAPAARGQGDAETADEAAGPVAVFIASQRSTPARARVLWWMPRSAAVRLCSDPRTSWKSSALHWTAQIDPDAQGIDWEFVADQRPEETAALFAELGIKPLSQEEFGERKPGTCHPRRWCNHAWPCGRDFEAWRATQPKSKAQFRRERQEAARAANAGPAVKQPEQPAGDAHEHAAAWIEMHADLGSGGTTYHAVCECGHEVGAWTGRQPGISTGTLSRPLTIADAPTSTGDSFAHRSGFDRTGPWQTVSESVRRAPISLRDEDLRPDFTPTCGELCGHSVICRPRSSTPPAPPAVDVEAADTADTVSVPVPEADVAAPTVAGLDLAKPAGLATEAVLTLF